MEPPKKKQKKEEEGKFSLVYSVDDEDEELQKTLALSLLSHYKEKGSPLIISLDDESFPFDQKIPMLESCSEPVPPRMVWGAPQLSYQLNSIKPTAASAILTTYKLDLDWLLEKFPVLKEIPVMLVHSHQGLSFECRVPPLLHLKQPKLPLSYGCCHGKIMLIKYPGFIRVAVSTANLLSFDYDRKTQGIWVQDFPKMDIKTPPVSPLAVDFQSSLTDYIVSLGLKASFLDDYSYETVKVILVTSVPGYHKGEAISKYGHMKVRKYMNNLILPHQFQDAPVIAQFSSIGSLSEPWVYGEFMESFMSRHESEFSEKRKKTTDGYVDLSEFFEKRKKTTGGDVDLSDSKKTVTPEKNRHSQNIKTIQKKNFKKKSENQALNLVWPTVDFVRNCIDGYAAGGSLCFPKNNLKNFLTKPNIFCSYNPSFKRLRIPPHIKTYTRVMEFHELDPSSENPKKEFRLAWVILTSSNLSKAAWGSLQKNGTQFMIRNYEAGILFLPLLDETFKPGPPCSLSKEVFFPLPYSLPLKPYGKDDHQWVWDVTYKEPDIFGNTWPE